MSYNLLLDTNFTQISSHWNLTNCTYVDGYLVGKSKTYSIEQELIIPKATKTYLSFDYICFDSNVKNIYCGVVANGTMTVAKRKVKAHKRKRISIINSATTEKIKIILIIESKLNSSRIHIDSPLFIDLNKEHKSWWPIKTLDKFFEYQCGHNYKNLYMEKEISFGNSDFHSPYTKIERGKAGIIATSLESDWFELNHINLKKDKKYLAKLNYIEINDFGDVYFQYGSCKSKKINENQIYIIFEGDPSNKLKLNLICNEMLPYIVNLKYIAVVELKDQNLSEEEIEQLPFI